MSNYKIKVNARQPTEEELNEHKDFNRVLLQYRRLRRPSPFYRAVGSLTRLLPALLLLLLLVAAVLAYRIGQKQKKASQPLKEGYIRLPKSFVQSSIFDNGAEFQTVIYVKSIVKN